MVAAHATELDALAERARRAAGTAQPLRLDAYGLVGLGFASLADGASRTASRAVAELGETMRRHADGLCADRQAYVTVDQPIATLLQEFR